jgi:hypothetical protein
MSARPVEYASWSSTTITFWPDFRPRSENMKLTAVGPCTPSFGTSRKKKPFQSPFVSDTRVAEPDANTRPALRRIGATAITSSEPAGPMTPMILPFEANCCATVDAFAGSSCVSPWTSLIFSLLFLFQLLKKNCAQCS